MTQPLAQAISAHALQLLARAVRLEQRGLPAAAEAARQAALFYLDATLALRANSPQPPPGGAGGPIHG